MEKYEEAAVSRFDDWEVLSKEKIDVKLVRFI